MFQAKRYRVVLTGLQPILGSQPQKDVAAEFLVARGEAKLQAASAGPEGEAKAHNTKRLPEIPEDELAALPEGELERGTSAFHRVNDRPVLFNYQVKGMLKEIAGAFNGQGGVKNAKSKVNEYVFVEPRVLPLITSDEVTHNGRPLRAETARGPRVSLVRSEQIETWRVEFTLKVYEQGKIPAELIRQWLEYGGDKGLGQWRNAGYGSFSFEMEEIAEEAPAEAR